MVSISAGVVKVFLKLPMIDTGDNIISRFATVVRAILANVGIYSIR